MKNIYQLAGHSSLFFIIVLSGCGPVINPYNENFKCQSKNTAGECIDTPTAYKKARYPEVDKEDQLQFTNKQKQKLQDNRYRLIANLLQKEKKPILQPPKILRVLLMPYKGENSELFMSRYVYLTIEDAQWVLTDLVEQ